MKRLLALLLCALVALAIPAACAQDAPETVRVLAKIEPLPFLDEPHSLWLFCLPIGAQDAYLIVCEGHAMMLDCGAVGREPNERLLFDLLDALNIERLDYVLNTHPHTDHYLGFEALLAEVPSGEFLTCFPEEYSLKQKRLLKAVRAQGVPVRNYVEGEPLSLGGAQLTTYRYHGIDNTNDLSLVVRVQYGERSVLLTADIASTAQRKLLEVYGDAWRSDVLKVPHHGVGRPARELLDVVQPQLCFVSNVRNKSSRTAWEYLEKRGFPLLYTARRFTAFTTDGQVWAVKQWPENEAPFPLR